MIREKRSIQHRERKLLEARTKEQSKVKPKTAKLKPTKKKGQSRLCKEGKITILTRKIRRASAKKNMEDAGITKICKPRFVINPKTGMIDKIGSILAENWRKYATQKKG